MRKVTVETVRAMKARGEKIASLTTYDYPTTRLLDEAGVPFLLVGDSVGMVVLGYPDTTSVTMEEMEHHVRAAARAKPRALLGADLPYRSYQDENAAVRNARRLITAGAEAVKAVLISQFGVDAARLSADGLGSTKPIDSKDTPQGRAQNRRVEFVRQ